MRSLNQIGTSHLIIRQGYHMKRLLGSLPAHDSVPAVVHMLASDPSDSKQQHGREV